MRVFVEEEDDDEEEEEEELVSVSVYVEVYVSVYVYVSEEEEEEELVVVSFLDPLVTNHTIRKTTNPITIKIPKSTKIRIARGDNIIYLI